MILGTYELGTFYSRSNLENIPYDLSLIDDLDIGDMDSSRFDDLGELVYEIYRTI